MSISFQTLEVWNIEPAGNIKSIELIAIFNVENIENLLAYNILNSKDEVISFSESRLYPKGSSIFPKFFETVTPDGIIKMDAWLVDTNGNRISNITTKTLRLKKAQPASGIGQKALEDPLFNLPDFPEATTEARSEAQHPTLISSIIKKQMQEVFVSPEEARAQIEPVTQQKETFEETKTRWYIETSPLGTKQKRKVSEKFIELRKKQGFTYELTEAPKAGENLIIFVPEAVKTVTIEGVRDETLTTQKVTTTVTGQNGDIEIEHKEEPEKVTQEIPIGFMGIISSLIVLGGVLSLRGKI